MDGKSSQKLKKVVNVVSTANNLGNGNKPVDINDTDVQSFLKSYVDGDANKFILELMTNNYRQVDDTNNVLYPSSTVFQYSVKGFSDENVDKLISNGLINKNTNKFNVTLVLPKDEDGSLQIKVGGIPIETMFDGKGTTFCIPKDLKNKDGVVEIKSFNDHNNVSVISNEQEKDSFMTFYKENKVLPTNRIKIISFTIGI